MSHPMKNHAVQEDWAEAVGERIPESRAGLLYCVTLTQSTYERCQELKGSLGRGLLRKGRRLCGSAGCRLEGFQLFHCSAEENARTCHQELGGPQVKAAPAWEQWGGESRSDMRREWSLLCFKKGMRQSCVM